MSSLSTVFEWAFLGIFPIDQVIFSKLNDINSSYGFEAIARHMECHFCIYQSARGDAKEWKKLVHVYNIRVL